MLNKVNGLYKSDLRKNKKWAEADILRQRIREKGYETEDASQGQKVEKIR